MTARALETNSLDKDAAVMVAKELENNPKFDDIGQGEWQCIIGKRFASALTYDTGVIAFFDILKFWKSILIFKSG